MPHIMLCYSLYTCQIFVIGVIYQTIDVNMFWIIVRVLTLPPYICTYLRDRIIIIDP